MSDLISVWWSRVKFFGDRRWWDVREHTEDRRYVICTRQADFKPKGELFYTIVDHHEGVRGPANVIGQGWDVVTDEGRQELIAELESGNFEVSHRNRVKLIVTNGIWNG